MLRPALTASISTVEVDGTVNGHPAGTEMFEGSGDKVLEKALPRAADHTRPMLFELSVVRGFDLYPDPRDLGIIVLSAPRSRFGDAASPEERMG